MLTGQKSSTKTVWKVKTAQSNWLTTAYEALVKESTQQYSVGDEVTMADICLAPTIEAALRWGTDTSLFPTTMAIYERIKALPAFEKGDWRHQDDTPDDLRPKS